MKRDEIFGRKNLLKNGKFFLAPPKDGSDLKSVFRQIVSSGAGRRVGKDGFPPGPWSPELMADAISLLASDGDGVDLRTVQHWFQDNEKGISPTNIRWLARVLGCDDPIATSEWQIALAAAQSRLAAKRRQQRNEPGNVASDVISSDDETATSHADQKYGESRRSSLALRTEAIFANGSPLDLPAAIFAGAVALGFLSYLLGVHSISYDVGNGNFKEVGFLWAPNWTLLFMVWMPLFFTVTINCLASWKRYRLRIIGKEGHFGENASWSDSYDVFNYTHWIVLIICLLFAGIVQWVAIRLRPIFNRKGNYAPDWGNISTIHPDIVSSQVEIFFTGASYIYMSVSFYLFFAGLIIIYAIIHDYILVHEVLKLDNNPDEAAEHINVARKILFASFRSTSLGLLIAMCMKLQSTYTAIGQDNIIAWLANDALTPIHNSTAQGNPIVYSLPTHYSSLIVGLASLVVFIFGALNLRAAEHFRNVLGKMMLVIAVLCSAYLLMGAFDGFSMLLLLALLLATLALYNPDIGRKPVKCGEGQQRVS